MTLPILPGLYLTVKPASMKWLPSMAAYPHWVKAPLQELMPLGGIIDISQLSKAAALQVLALSDAPVIASHSNVWQLSNVSRNLSDAEIDRIGATGGVIHVAPFRGYLFDSSDQELDRGIRAARRAAGIQEDFYYPFELYWEIKDESVQQKFLTTVSDLLGPGSIDDVINHIDYIADRIGSIMWGLVRTSTTAVALPALMMPARRSM